MTVCRRMPSRIGIIVSVRVIATKRTMIGRSLIRGATG